MQALNETMINISYLTTDIYFVELKSCAKLSDYGTGSFALCSVTVTTRQDSLMSAMEPRNARDS